MGGAAVIRRLPCRSPVYRSSFGGVFGNGRARFGQIVAGVGVGNLESAQAFGFGGVVTDAGRREDVDFLVGEVSKSSDDVGFLDYGVAALQVALAEGRSVWEEDESNLRKRP